jgi:hypothetical protein
VAKLTAKHVAPARAGILAHDRLGALHVAFGHPARAEAPGAAPAQRTVAGGVRQRRVRERDANR